METAFLSFSLNIEDPYNIIHPTLCLLLRTTTLATAQENTDKIIRKLLLLCTNNNGMCQLAQLNSVKLYLCIHLLTILSKCFLGFKLCTKTAQCSLAIIANIKTMGPCVRAIFIPVFGK